MTQKEFNKLSLAEQDIFLEEGGVISDSVHNELANMSRVMISPAHIIDDHQNRPVGGEVNPPPSSDGSSGFPSNQPVSDIYANGFDIESPLELLYLLDDDICSGRVKLHTWQMRILSDFALGGISDTHPFQAVVRACNGSGKDKYVIAPCVVWLCMKYKMATGVVTSSSGAQLDRQTCRYIKSLCMATNRKFGVEIWTCVYRHYVCRFGNELDDEISEIFCYATDEPGKAEGYHPLAFGRKMGLFASEDKTIPDEINVAMNKCTGYTHRLHVSTPGLPMGHFYDYCSLAQLREYVTDINKTNPEDFIQYHVRAKDCSHISKAYLEQMKRDLPGGENGAAYKSQVEAEFGTTDEMVVIPYTYIWRAFTHTVQYPQPEWIVEPYNKAGLDLSDGGDETVLTVRNGNKHLKTIPFRFDNTEDTVAFLDEKFKEYDLTNPESFIYADCGGLGKPMLDRLKRMGWSNIRYIDNRNKASYPKTYLNRGTELWFHCRKLFERHELILLKDDKLIRQLSTRYYKMDLSNRHRLLSKPESRSKGYPSPDRADSFVLAFWDYKSTFVEEVPEKEEDRPVKRVPYKKPVGTFTQQSYASRGNTLRQRLGPKRDNSRMLELIEEHNRQIKLNKITVEQVNQ